MSACKKIDPNFKMRLFVDIQIWIAFLHIDVMKKATSKKKASLVLPNLFSSYATWLLMHSL